MTYTPEGEEEPPQVRRLRQMVMVLIVVLILGFLAIAGTIVIRLGFPDRSAGPVTASELVVPEGFDIRASGQGPGTLHLLLRGSDGVEMLFIYDGETGVELSRTTITRN